MKNFDELIKKLNAGPITVELLEEAVRTVKDSRDLDLASVGWIASWLKDKTELLVLHVLNRNPPLDRHALDGALASALGVSKREITSLFNNGDVLERLLGDELVEWNWTDNPSRISLTECGRKKLEGMR